MRRYAPGLKMRRLSNVQLAYLAGIIDGEGSICITKARNKKAGRLGYGYRPVLHVANTHMRVLRILQRQTGLGKARLFDDARPNRKARWQWMVWSRQAEQIVRAALPFLIIKRRQAKLFLEFIRLKNSMGCNGPIGRSRKEWTAQDKIYRRMKKLNA